MCLDRLGGLQRVETSDARRRTLNRRCAVGSSSDGREKQSKMRFVNGMGDNGSATTGADRGRAAEGRGQMVATWLRKLGACPFLNLVPTKAPHGDSEQVCLAGRLHKANVQEPLLRLLTHAYGILAMPAMPCFNTLFLGL